MKNTFFYIAGALTMIWGIVHLFPTRNVVRDFGEIISAALILAGIIFT